jgi:hypothetical protein
MTCEHDFRVCQQICPLPAVSSKSRLASISQLEKLRLLCNYELELWARHGPERGGNEDKKGADVSR